MNILRNLLVLGFSLFFISNALGFNTVFNGLPHTKITLEVTYYSNPGRFMWEEGWRTSYVIFPGRCFGFFKRMGLMPFDSLKISSPNRVLYQCEGEENCKKTAFLDRVVVQGADGQPLLVPIPEVGIDGDSIDCDTMILGG